MFYVFYLASDNNINFNQVKNSVINNTPVVSSDIAEGRPQIYDDTNELLNIWCEYFSLSLKNGGQHTEFRSEDYGMKFKYQFWFDVYTASPEWMKGMLTFIGEIMKEYNGNCVLESNGDTPIMMRKDGEVIVDDSNLRGTQRFPFHYLGVGWQEGNLKMV